MNDWTQVITSRTGLAIHIRPARGSDKAGLAELFIHVTREDLRFPLLTGRSRDLDPQR